MEKTENDGATEKAAPVLSLSDICDSCPSTAYVRVVIGTKHIDLCGHHYAKNEYAIDLAGYPVIDERDRLLDRSYALDVWTKGGINARNR